MAVETLRVPFHDWVRMPGRVEVRRWVCDPGGYWQVRYVYLGWRPDGAWWVHATGAQEGWLFVGDVQREVRAAAEVKAADLRVGDGWQPEIILAGGVYPPTPAVIVEWPPGLEPR